MKKGRSPRPFQFGGDAEDASQGRLSVYVSNKTRSAALMREAAVVTNDSLCVAADDGPEKGLLLRPLPLTVDPGDLTLVCVLLVLPANAVKNLAVRAG